MNNIVLIDDDVDFFRNTFQIEAQTRSFKVIHKTSLEGLKAVLPKYEHSVSAVVLDIKCLITGDQVKEDAGFIGTALKYLDTHCPRFPRIILTGDDVSFGQFKSFNPDEIVFQKTPQGILDAFHKLQFYSDNSDDLRIRRQNLEIFSLLNGKKFPPTAEATLLNVLKNIDETSFPKFGGLLRDIRALQEIIYKTINSTNKLVVPDAMFQGNGMIKFNDLMKHLNGNPISVGKSPTTNVYQNQAIFNLSNSLYWASGKYIHADPKEAYLISNYSIKSMAYSLMELFLWSRPFIK